MTERNNGGGVSSRARQPMADPDVLDPSGTVDAAECSILAAMMLRPDAIERARACLSASDFYRDGYSRVFSAILALADRGEKADVVTVTAELRRRDDLDAVGGPAAIAGVFELATTTAN